MTRLYITDNSINGQTYDLGVVTTMGGPKSVDVVTYLKSMLATKLEFVEGDDYLRTLIHMSLGNKGDISHYNISESQILSIYLSGLDRKIVLCDLLLCASLLQGGSLQLNDGSFYPVSVIRLDKK